MKMSERMKRALSTLLCVLMLVQNVPMTALAAAEDNLCEHHTAHTAECHYAEAVEGKPCTHSHDAACGYVQAVDEVKCGCTAVDESGALVHTEGCGYVAPVAGKDCTHAHDAACGYVAEVKAHDCHYECAQCAAEEEGSEPSSETSEPSSEASEPSSEASEPSSEPVEPSSEASEPSSEASEPSSEPVEPSSEPTDPVCTCGTDDSAFHATNCPAYEPSAEPKCYCAEKCTETNVWCEICGFDYTACTGTDTAAVYIISVDYNRTTDILTVSGTGTVERTAISSNRDFASILRTCTTIIINAGITGIGETAFSDFSGVTSITIPEGVTSIGKDAFYNCTGLTSVTIPASVTSIGERAFSECKSLTEIIVAEGSTAYKSVDGMLLTADGKTLIACPAGKTGAVSIPEGVTSIGDYAFSGCTGLTSVAIPAGVTSIGTNAFSGCTGLTSVTIPASVTSIGEYAFNFCTGLTSVTIPASVTSIGNRAFYRCTGLASVTYEGTSKPTVGDNVFHNAQVTAVNVPCTYEGDTFGTYSITSAHRWSDSTCTVCEKTCDTLGHEWNGSTTLCCGKDCTDLGHDMVYDATQPATCTEPGAHSGAVCNRCGYTETSGTIPALGHDWNEGVQTLAPTCTEAGRLTVTCTRENCDETENRKITALGHDFDSDNNYLCKNGCGYSGGSCGENLTWTLKDGALTISGTGTMENYTSSSAAPWGKQITSVTIESDVTSIGEFAFYDCSALASLTFAEGSKLETIGSYAFYNTALTSVDIPAGVTLIDSYAFRRCQALASVTFAEGSKLETIVNYAFANTALKSVTIPASVTSITYLAFYESTGLTEVLVAEGSNTYQSSNGMLLTKDGTTLLLCPQGKTTAAIPAGVTTIGENAFYPCGKLTSVTIPASVTTIGNTAFSGCSALTSVTFAEGSKLETISGSAFSQCKSLTSVTIPGGVTSIGSYAFNYCNGLASVTYEGTSEPTVGDNAFKNTQVTAVNVPCTYEGDTFGDKSVTKAHSWSDGTCTVCEKSCATLGHEWKDGTALCCNKTCIDLGHEWKDGITLCCGKDCTELGHDMVYVETTQAATCTKTGAYIGAACKQCEFTEDGPGVIPVLGHDWNEGVQTLAPTCTEAGMLTVTCMRENCGETENRKITALGHDFDSDNNYLCKNGCGYSGGSCGTNLTWTLKDGALTISGTGAMANYTFGSAAPWGTEITGVTIESGVTTIGNYAFMLCKKLTAVSIPETVTTIGESAFQACSGLTKIDIPSSVKTLGQGAFCYCSGLKSLTIPDGVTTINADLVSYCTALEEIIIPDSVVWINDWAFKNCSSLKAVTIPAKVQRIGTQAFNACSSLTEVTIPASVTKILSSAFHGCTNLAKVTYLGTTAPSVKDGAFNYTKVTAVNVPCNYTGTTFGDKSITKFHSIGSDGKCTCGAVGGKCGENATWVFDETTGQLTISGTGKTYTYSYSGPGPWNQYADKIKSLVVEEGITELGDYLMYGYTALQSISLPASLTKIGSFAFYNCSALTDITLAANAQLATIGEYAFSGCTSLNDKDIFSAPLTSIGQYAFKEAGYTGVIAVPNVTSMGQFAFYVGGKPALVVIAPNAFLDTTKAPVTLGYTVKDNKATITDFYMKYSSGFSDDYVIGIPQTVGGIPIVEVTQDVRTNAANASKRLVIACDGEHRWDTAKTTCLVCGYTTKCGENAFWSFDETTKTLTISGEGPMTDYTFKGVTVLADVPWKAHVADIEKLVVGEGITTIGKSAFNMHSALKEVRLPETLTSIGYYSFNGCTGLTGDLVLPPSVTVVDQSAFVDCTQLSVFYPAAAFVNFATFRGTKAYTPYEVGEGGRKTITAPIPAAIQMPALSYTGNDLKEDALKAAAFCETVTIGGETFGVNIKTGTEGTDSWTFSIKEEKVVDVGTYTLVCSGWYVATAQSESSGLRYWEKTVETTFQVKPSDGSGQVTLAGWTYGGTPADPVPTSTTNGTENVTYQWKAKNDSDEAYQAYAENTYPVNAGTYVLKAVFPATENCSEAIATTEFTIARAAVSSVTVDVTAPEQGAEPQSTVTGGTGYTAAIRWNTDAETFGFNTQYTATVTLTPDGNHQFADGITVDGWQAENNNGILTLTRTFDATRKPELQSVTPPPYYPNFSNYHATANDANKELAGYVKIKTEIGEGIVKIQWACDNYSPAAKATNTFTWTVVDGELAAYANSGNVATTGTITVTNVDAIGVNNSGTDAEITYNGNTYDVAQMFTMDPNAGTPTYSIAGSNGQGTLNGSVLTITKAGTFKIKLTTAANGAYAAGEATATLTVNKGEGSGTVTMADWTYGETAKAPETGSTTGNSVESYLYESTDDKGYSSANAPTNAGAYKLTVTFAATDLYEAATAEDTFTIAQAALTVTPKPHSITYGKEPANNGVEYSGFVNGDNESALVGNLTYSYTYHQYGDVGKYGIDCEGLTSDNYDIDFENGELTVTAKKITVTARAAEKIYGSGDPEFAYDVDGLVNGDTLTGALSREVGENVGTYAITQGTLKASSNYTVDYTGKYLTVKAMPITVTAGNQTVTYGEAISQTAVSASGLLEGHRVTATLTPDTENVTISGTITAEDAKILNGDDDVTANYAISYASGRLTIKPDTALIDALTTENVTSANKTDIEYVQKMMEDAKKEGIGEDIEAQWDAITEKCEALLEKIEAAAAENKRIADEAKKYELDTVKSSDEEAIAALIGDIDAQLATNNLTDAERTELTGQKTRLENLIAKIDSTEALIESLDKTVDDTDEDIVKSTDKAKLEQVIEDAKTLIDSGNVTVAEKETLEQIQEDAQALIDVIDQTAEDIKAATEKAGAFDPETVTSADQATLEAAKKDIEAVLDTENLTDAERAALEEVLEQVEEMIGTVTDTAGDIRDVTELIGGLDEATVNSGNKAALEDAIETIDKLLSDTHLTDGEKETLEKAKADAEAMLDVIQEVQDAITTDKTDKVKDVTADTVKPSDKTALEEARADLEKTLKDNADNYTGAEKEAIEQEIQRIDAALEALKTVEDLTAAIGKLPETVEPDDEKTAEKILAAKEAYDALTAHEKSLVDKAVKEKLTDLVADLTDYKIIKGNGSRWSKGSRRSLAFTANGPYSKFVSVEVDGKEVHPTYYDAESGSTIITLKQTFLKRLSTGKHTITVVYTDGEATGTFRVLPKASSPATGDDSNIQLLTSVMVVSFTALAVLLAMSRKRRNSAK